MDCPNCGKSGTLRTTESSLALTKTISCSSCGFQTTKKTDTGEMVQNVSIGASILAAVAVLWKNLDKL